MKENCNSLHNKFHVLQNIEKKSIAKKVKSFGIFEEPPAVVDSSVVDVEAVDSSVVDVVDVETVDVLWVVLREDGVVDVGIGEVTTSVVVSNSRVRIILLMLSRKTTPSGSLCNRILLSAFSIKSVKA